MSDSTVSSSSFLATSPSSAPSPSSSYASSQPSTLSPAPKTLKDSPAGKGLSKKGKAFRASTLFPQATFVHQLGLDKLSGSEKLIGSTPEGADNMVALDYSKLEKIQKKEADTPGKPPDTPTTLHKTPSSQLNNTAVINQNGKRARGNSSESNRSNARQTPTPRSNTVSSSAPSAAPFSPRIPAEINAKTTTPDPTNQTRQPPAKQLPVAPAKVMVPPINTKGTNS